MAQLKRTETHDVNVFFHVNADKKVVNRILERIIKSIGKEGIETIEIKDETNVDMVLCESIDSVSLDDNTDIDEEED